MRPLAALVLAGLLFFGVPNTAAQDGPIFAGEADVPTTDPHPESDRWVEATLLVAQPDLLTMDVTAFLTIRKFEVDGTDYESADEISDAYSQLVQADAFAREKGQDSGRADNFVEDMERSVSSAMQQMLGDAFAGANVTVDLAVVDRSTFVAPDGQPFAPGISVLANARIVRTPAALGLGDFSQEDVDALLDAGALMTSSLTFSSPVGYELSYLIEPVEGTAFTAASGATLAGDKVLVDLPYGSPPTSFSLTLAGTNAPSHDAQDAEIAITVDLRDLDVSLGKAMGGDFGNLFIDLTVDAEILVLEMPEDLQASLPSQVSLDFLSAGSLRMLLERGLLTETNLTTFDAKILDQIEDKLGATLGGAIPIEGGFVRASFAPALAADKPVAFHATARLIKPLSGGGVQPQAAIALYSTQLPLELPKLEGLDTLYTVILPKGLALTGLEATGGTAERGRTEAGRDQFTVRPTSESAEVTLSMAVTPTLVLAKFWPIVLLALILVVLIVGAPIAFVVRSRGKKRKNKAAKE